MKKLVVVLMVLLFVSCNQIEPREFKLTEDEQEWVDNHPIVYYAPDLEFAPYEYLDDMGDMKGLVADYLKKIEDIIGIEIKIVQTESWSEAVTLARANDVNMLFMTKTEERTKNFEFSEPFIFSPNVMIINKNFTLDIEDDKLDQYTFGLMKDYASSEFFKILYSEASIIEYDTITKGLLELTTGRVDVFVADLAQASYYINNLGFNELIVYESLDFDYKFTFAVNKEYAVLANIINKAIDSLTEKEHAEIREKWFQAEYKNWLNRNRTRIVYLVSIITFFIAAVLTLIIFIMRRIIKRKTMELQQINIELEQRVFHRTKELTDVNQKLEDSIKELVATQDKLIDSEMYASLGKLVSGVAHQINTPLGASITSNSYCQRKLQQLIQLYKDNHLSKSCFEETTSSVHESLLRSEKSLEFIAETLKRFRKLESTLISASKSHLNLKNSIHKSIQQMKSQNQIPDGYNITVDIEEHIQIHTSALWIDEIVHNIINNSIVHGQLDKDVIIIKGTMNNGIILSFEDHGAGIPEEEMTQIFEPFFTHDHLYHHPGLGLSIVKNIVVNKLGGAINIESHPYEKTKITITLPK